jgi:hypothetical protein
MTCVRKIETTSEGDDDVRADMFDPFSFSLSSSSTAALSAPTVSAINTRSSDAEASSDEDYVSKSGQFSTNAEAFLRGVVCIPLQPLLLYV